MTEKTSSSVIWGKIRALSHRQIPRALTLISNNTLHTNPTTSNILGQHFATPSPPASTPLPLTATEITTQILQLYTNGFPHQWREAIIVPILKPGKPATSASS
jgi:hypothetical protein